MDVFIDKKLSNYLIKIANSSPFEQCGLLLGKIGKSSYYITKFEQVKNIAKIYQEADYLMDPQGMMDVLSKTTKFDKESDIDFIGIWHTHPKWKAIPSSIDINRVAYKVPYLITSSLEHNTKAYMINKIEKNYEELQIIEVE